MNADAGRGGPQARCREEEEASAGGGDGDGTEDGATEQEWGELGR